MRRRDLEEGGFRAVGLGRGSAGRVEGSRGPRALSCGSRGQLGLSNNHSHSSTALVAALAQVPAQACRCVWGGDGVWVTYCYVPTTSKYSGLKQ